jgi:hypothetical protein
MSFIHLDAKITIRLERDQLAEVRDPETGELVEHMWVPDDEVIDLSQHVTTFKLDPREDDR